MKKILIIEDEADFADLLKVRLEASGYQAIIATNGCDGIEAAIQEKPDLILLDIAMSGMDGYQTGEKLRQDERTRDVGILFMTCKDLESKSLIKRCEKIGAAGYFDKLSDFDDLLKKIKGLIG